MSIGITLRLIPARGGIVYECPECEERFLPALADRHRCEAIEEWYKSYRGSPEDKQDAKEYYRGKE